MVFVASDALAHHILMMYEAVNRDRYGDELKEVMASHAKNGQWVKNALEIRKIYWYDKVLEKLLNTMGTPQSFGDYIAALRRKKLIAHDDYSLGVL